MGKVDEPTIVASLQNILEYILDSTVITGRTTFATQLVKSLSTAFYVCVYSGIPMPRELAAHLYGIGHAKRVRHRIAATVIGMRTNIVAKSSHYFEQC